MCFKGCFLRAYDKGIYYKLSNYDNYFKTFGNESSIYEVIAYRVRIILELPTLKYWICKENIIIDGNELYSVFCASKDFNLDKKKKVNIETIYALEKQQDDNIFKFCERLGVIDYIIYNQDRHGANIEFLIQILDGWVLKCYSRSGLGFKYHLQLDNTVGIFYWFFW